MSKRRALFVIALVATLTVAAWAAKAAPAIATFLTSAGPTGVFHDDTSSVYDNGVQSIKVYFGVTGKDANIVTYNTPRKLRFVFDPASTPYVNSNLPAGGNFTAEVDMFALNYFGPYRNMGVGTTAQVQMDLEFKVGNLTYELDYSSLSATRLDETTWLITSYASDVDFNPVAASPQARLNVIRRKAQETFGVVNMPIRFEMQLK